MPSLNTKKVAALREPGMYGDGGGLYLRVGPGGGKSWILRIAVHGRRRNLGLGSAALVPLAEAREKARVLRKVAREGGDPDTVRRRESLTFEEAARRVHADLTPTWKNAKHAEEWFSSVRRYALPAIGDRPLHTVGTADLLAILTPIWTEKHETAKRLRQRFGVIFDWAKSAGHYPAENPVNGIKKGLAPVRARPVHMEALPWREVPAFMAELAQRQGVSARTLELLILTAARSGEARGMRWAEVTGDVWTVAAERMKRGLPHRVPLSPQALTVLDHVRGLGPDLVFPSAMKRAEEEQSVNVFRSLFARMGREGMTAHGFRSSFRDWASESAHALREVAEAALSHAVGDATERSYARSDHFERRRALMEAWGRFATGQTGEVVRLAR